MERLEIDVIVKKIKAGELFSALAKDGSFEIKINKYMPYYCSAIHDGSNLRDNLKNKIAIDDYGRWYEEDPFTADFISSMPITIVGKDSRYEYDLNRTPELCVYEEVWGRKVWKKKLQAKELQESRQKHANFYKVIHALVEKLESLFGACLVYDIHSYNYKRWEREVPLFNIGSENVTNPKFLEYIEHWRQELQSIELPDVKNITAVNDVFYGRGYHLKFIKERFKNTLVLATEVKKIYCDEETGKNYPKLVKQLQQKLKHAILSNANHYCLSLESWKHVKISKLLDKKYDTALLKADKSMFNLLKNFELLAFVNPKNSGQERKKFFKSNYIVNPQFTYSPINIHPYQLKQQLASIRTQDIDDVSIRHMYEAVLNSYFDKTDLLSTLNTSKFLFNSLRYFGRPSKKDLLNANYILHLPYLKSEAKASPSVSAKDAVGLFEKGLESYGIKAKIELSSKSIAQVMVLNSKKMIRIRPDAKFTPTEINALIAHEIGVHMLTTINSSEQKLKIFNLGLPVNTMTQEGMAILAEYLSGNLTMERLKKLACRVVVVDMMCNGATFSECFKFLIENHIKNPNDAYSVVTRIFRGGGFTKDFLYLRGFVEVLRFWEKKNNMDPLFVGKTSLDFFNTIDELLERDLIVKPSHIANHFITPDLSNSNDIYDYILSGLKA